MINGNLFTKIPQEIPQEITETLLSNKAIRIERIISKGHQSDEDFWYDQEEHEWVLILEGSGIIEFKDAEIKMEKGDFLYIPAHQQHRVKWTDPIRETIWLAIFYE